jgi:hypothetical protein
MDYVHATERPPEGGGLWFLIQNLAGGSLVALGAGLAIAAIVFVVGFVLRAGYETLAWGWALLTR